MLLPAETYTENSAQHDRNLGVLLPTPNEAMHLNCKNSNFWPESKIEWPLCACLSVLKAKTQSMWRPFCNSQQSTVAAGRHLEAVPAAMGLPDLPLVPKQGMLAHKKQRKMCLLVTQLNILQFRVILAELKAGGPDRSELFMNCERFSFADWNNVMKFN